ncbi:MAG: VLRF1 family aeRF1-type release factor, partial [Nitriliruptorales bacterium]|nr:VLRF1 family aeRF1-type release factor [Nitriliruptorales bacterium]
EHDRWQAVESRLDELESGALAALLDPKAHGQGRALFAAVQGDRTETVSLQIPFRERVSFAHTPSLRPLVAAHDEGRAAGILVVSRQGAELLEWAVGQCEQLATWDFEIGDAQVADIKSGPSANNPRLEQRGLVNRERFEDRIDENRSRFLREVIGDAQATVKDRSWDRLVVSGSPKIRDEVVEALPTDNGLRVLRADNDWEGLSPSEISDRAWPVLRSVHRQREVELVEAAKGRALSGGAGALGMKKVCDALNQGQVSHLLFQADLEATGYSTDEGTLHPSVSGSAAQAGFEMHEEPLFVERLVEKVLETSGRVTPLDDEAADLLDEHDGIAALLRW